MLKDISRNNVGILLATHDLDMVEKFADRISGFPMFRSVPLFT